MSLLVVDWAVFDGELGSKRGSHRLGGCPSVLTLRGGVVISRGVPLSCFTSARVLEPSGRDLDITHTGNHVDGFEAIEGRLAKVCSWKDVSDRHAMLIKGTTD